MYKHAFPLLLHSFVILSCFAKTAFDRLVLLFLSSLVYTSACSWIVYLTVFLFFFLNTVRFAVRARSVFVCFSLIFVAVL